MKNDIFNQCMTAFKKIDKVVSSVFLYYASICGFIFSSVILGLLSFSISGTVPVEFVFMLRFFFFLISFLVGLKLTILFMNLFRKRIS